MASTFEGETERKRMEGILEESFSCLVMGESNVSLCLQQNANNMQTWECKWKRINYSGCEKERW